MVKELLGILGILILLVEIYQFIRRNCLHRLPEKKKKEKQSRISPILRPKSERDCRFCKEDQGKLLGVKRVKVISWQVRKGRGGPKKKVATEGYFFPNQHVEYYRITADGSMR